MTGDGTNFYPQVQHLVCPCNQVSDFPQRCPYHTPVDYYKFYTPPQYWPKFTTDKQAWLCPRCDKMNAPHTDQCSCDGKAGWTLTYPTTTDTTIGTISVSTNDTSTANKHQCTENDGCKAYDCNGSRK
jgi:hypothetical protein